MKPVHTLVIACGNPLRGDDGIGPTAAEVVQTWQIPGVAVIAIHQLVPELVDDMKHADRILFIDAAISAGDSAFESCIVKPTKSRRSFGHHETPANLLALLQDLEGRTPEAWLVMIAGTSFEHGTELSASARANLQATLAWIRDWLWFARS